MQIERGVSLNPPLRSVAVFAAGFLCVATCFATGAGKAPPTTSPAEDQEAAAASSSPPVAMVNLPGPLRPFLRLAGISQEISASEVLPLLARNVSLWGYDGNKPTEYLVLVTRYVQLAKELQALGGAEGRIRVGRCEDAEQLIRTLGYKFENGCSAKGATLMTADPERAFLTIDSGFPLTTLEEDLEKGIPFSYAFPATPVPVLFSERTWTSLSPSNKRTGNDIVSVLLRDKNVDHLYSALAKSDRQTRFALFRAPGLRRLLPDAAALDFYGSWISIRSGQVNVPGGAKSEDAWKELVGASPKSQGEFVIHLLERDKGWLAAYYDAMARLTAAQQARFVESDRLSRLYDAYRDGSRFSFNTAAAGVFPRNAGLLVLLTRTRWEPNGEPQVPGGLDAWKDVMSHSSDTEARHGGAANARAWNSPDQLLETMVSSSVSESAGASPSQIYLMVSAIDGGRPAERRLSDATVRLLGDRYFEFNKWYPIFAEFPALDDAAIAGFIDAASKIDKINNPALRANALGSFQAEVGLWQIFARQGQIPSKDLNASWKRTVDPYLNISTNVQLFEAAHGALNSILTAAGGDPHMLAQNQMVELLAGPAQNSADGKRAHQELARRIRAVLDDERLVSLDTLIGLFEGIDDVAHKKASGDSLLPLAAELREFEMPRPIFSGNEKASWAPVVYSSRHAELQVRTDLTQILRTGGTAAQLEHARGLLTPFLRDTLVGLNYAYYEPPGAQVLHNNPLFVRSHDFTASSVQGIEHVWGSPELIGVGVTAGGGAYLLGSLADLPYALASMEQDFIAPAKVQALIWQEIVPEFLVNSVLPRWWGVAPGEMHAAALYQRAGEELLIQSASDPALREKVLGILADRMPPARLETTAEALEDREMASDLRRQMLPADTFFLTEEFRRRYPEQDAVWGQSGKELLAVSKRDPEWASAARIAKDFGVPHLELAQSDSCTLLNTSIFPASGAFDGRLFGESWESSNLYWARVADEMGYSPAMLNVLVPNLTRTMVANIFATEVNDWPALLRALNETGDQFRKGKITVRGATTMAGQPDGVPMAAAKSYAP